MRNITIRTRRYSMVVASFLSLMTAGAFALTTTNMMFGITHPVASGVLQVLFYAGVVGFIAGGIVAMMPSGNVHTMSLAVVIGVMFLTNLLFYYLLSSMGFRISSKLRHTNK